MKSIACTIFVLLILDALPPGNASAADMPVCSKDELLAYVPDSKEVGAHRQFTLPKIDYAFGTQLESYEDGLQLMLRVDQFGDVVCYSRTNRFGETQPLNEQRRDVIREIHKWHYAPFAADEHAVAAIVTETVAEQELPKETTQAPAVPMDQVRLTLRRSGCYGSCPSYSVEVDGNGQAVYTGGHFVDVTGEHRYSIAPKAVAKLVDSLRAKDLWSLRDAYRARITDNPTYQITMQLGEQIHSIEDYVGRAVGMPATVTEFENEIDEVAESENWIHLSQTAVERLKAEGFAFASQEGGAMLARAITNPDSHDDKAMLELIKLGAPVDDVVGDQQDYREHGSLLELALKHGRSALLEALSAKGALLTNGTPDQQKLDEAFRAAIIGGKFAIVREIWNAGENVRPALTFPDRGYENESPQQQSPVTLLLSPPYRNTNQWQGREIAQWLEEQGCNLAAHGTDGTTLLHIAARSGDVTFVRYLLDRGVDPSTPGHFGLPALGSAHSEDVAMILLEAGTDIGSLNDKDSSFRKFAEYNHWQRVITWLDGHPAAPRRKEAVPK